MRASPIQYELEGLGLSHEQIKKIMTRLPTSSIPLFIESWKREKHEKEASRRSYNVTVPEEYCPRIIPEIAPQRSTEKIESDYQKYTQQRNGINENMNLMAIRFSENHLRMDIQKTIYIKNIEIFHLYYIPIKIKVTLYPFKC